MNRYLLKREVAARAGVTGWKWRHLPAGLFIFNYHRIGNPAQTQFDPNVYSATEEQFASQLRIIASRFQVINMETLLAALEVPGTLDEPTAMITFDDGYVDNFSASLPILRSLGLSAVFFLPTDFIEQRALPWWEEAAWLVRNTALQSLTLPGHAVPIALDRSDIGKSIREVLRYFKDLVTVPLEEKMTSLRQQCQVDCAAASADDLFLNWDQVGEMQRQGMDIGSHTCSHRILSHLDLEEQRAELAESKQLIEARIGAEVPALAYPVGGVDSYSAQTRELARQCGYRAAFSFPTGGAVALDPASCPFEIPRLSVDGLPGRRDIQHATVFAPRI